MKIPLPKLVRRMIYSAVCFISSEAFTLSIVQSTPDSIFLPTNAGDLSLDSFRYFVHYRRTFVDDCEFSLQSRIFTEIAAKYRLKCYENALELSNENSGKGRRNKERNSLALLLNNTVVGGDWNCTLEK